MDRRELQQKKWVLRSQWFIANEYGRYKGGSCSIYLSETHIKINRKYYPLNKVVKAGRKGRGMYLDYLDHVNIRRKLFLTTYEVFGIAIGRNRKIEEFLETLEALKGLFRKKYPNWEEVEATGTICHTCGDTNGKELVFERAISIVIECSRKKHKAAFCPTHAWRQYLKFQVATSFLGWWSRLGLVFTPVILVKNMAQLASHTDLSKLQLFGVLVLSFLPGILAIVILNWLF